MVWVSLKYCSGILLMSFKSCNPPPTRGTSTNIFRKIASFGSKKWTSPVATTRIPFSSPAFIIFLITSLMISAVMIPSELSIKWQ